MYLRQRPFNAMHVRGEVNYSVFIKKCSFKKYPTFNVHPVYLEFTTKFSPHNPEVPVFLFYFVVESELIIALMLTFRGSSRKCV